jgi:nucleoside-diphosphate kinase
MAIQQTYIMIKPEGVQRRLVSSIIERFERKGLTLKNIKSMIPPKEIVEEHYGHLKEKFFFDDMVKDLCSDLVICMVWEGIDAVEVCRKIIGSTNPLQAEMGSIRGDLASDISANVVHGSDSVETAEREIKLWFR